MFHERYSAEEYERLATRFEAAAFDAATARRLSAGESCQTLTATGYGFARDVHHFRPASERRDGLITTVRLDLA